MTRIVVDDVWKSFRRHAPERPTTLHEALVRGFRFRRAEGTFWALRGVSLEVSEGRTVGLIGRNGAGKSTLLRLVGGVGRPDRGGIEVRGHLGGLLEIGAGFHPDLTGAENVLVNGVISGLTEAEVERRFDEIVQFAGLGDFIENPLRTYSAGMQMRLGFSIAVHVEPEVLLMDEILAVGDIAFQGKCLKRIAALRRSGHTILIASHELPLLEDLCDEVVWLEAGRVAGRGPAREVVGAYRSAAGPERGAEQRAGAPRG